MRGLDDDGRRVRDAMTSSALLAQYREENRTAYRRIAELEAEVSDWRDGAKQAMAEPAHGNEAHCTCVPALRKEVERLRGLLEGARGRDDQSVCHTVPCVVCAALAAEAGEGESDEL